LSATTINGTLNTAAQPNITSVGTLGSLEVTNGANVGSLSVTTSALAPTPAFGDNSNNVATTAFINDREIFKTLSANEAATAATTAAEVTGLTTPTLAAGTYVFEYHMRFQTSNTGAGIRVAINYTGTVTTMNYRLEHGTTGGAAATGVTDNESTTLTGQTMEALNTGTNNTTLITTGTAVVNTPMYATVRGLLVCSATGTLQFKFATEANTATLLAGTSLILKRIN